MTLDYIYKTAGQDLIRESFGQDAVVQEFLKNLRRDGRKSQTPLPPLDQIPAPIASTSGQGNAHVSIGGNLVRLRTVYGLARKIAKEAKPRRKLAFLVAIKANKHGGDSLEELCVRLKLITDRELHQAKQEMLPLTEATERKARRYRAELLERLCAEVVEWNSSRNDQGAGSHFVPPAGPGPVHPMALIAA